jgi:hypothetical protein
MTLQIELSLRGAERRSNLNVRLDDRSHPFASHRQHSLCEIGSTDGGANEPIRGLEANFCTGVDNHNYFIWFVQVVKIIRGKLARVGVVAV